MKMDWPPEANNKDQKTEDTTTQSSENKKKDRFKRIPLTEEDRNLSGVEFASKYGLSTKSAHDIKKQGYRSISFYRQPLNELEIERRKILKNRIEEIDPIEVSSIETALVTPVEQEKIKEIVKEYDNLLRYDNLKTKKFFKFNNGKEVSLGDLIVLDKLAGAKVFRNEKDQLMMFDKDENKYIPFNPLHFFGEKKSFTFKDDIKDIKLKNKRIKYDIRSLESFSPQVFKLGIFKEKDFNKRSAGSASYEINGPHERSLSKTSPYVTFSNANGRANYYVGRDKFVGTDKKINHETVKVSLLDNNTGVVTDVINGRKIILYTFPLLGKEQFEKTKEEIIERRAGQNKNFNEKRINDCVTETVSLKEYSTPDYISKNSNETDKDYTERISRLSDISYVLGNFRSFMSETGLAANNYSWKEQLILADTLTTAGDESKIKKLGRNFGKNGLRTFLSVEQGGSEMGNKILELGEKLPEDVVEEIFKGYSHLIDSAEKVRDTLSRAFENEKNTLLKKVPNQIHEALLLRAKDVLIGAHKIVMEDESKLNPDDVIKALAGITLMLDMLADLDKKELFNFTKIEETKKNLFKYRVEDKNEQAYDLKIFIRPRAEENAQARVNFELSFDTENPNKELQEAFYNKTHFVAKNKTIEGSALRIGIDRDTYGEEDLVSLDLGRSEDSGSNFDRTGDVLGKLLVFATESNIGHHTTSSFDKELADEETFSKICSKLIEYLNHTS